MTDTPNLALTEISATQAQKEVTANENFYEIDGWIPKVALEISLSANHAPGAVYIVASAATGPFLGQDHNLAFSIASDWYFKTPPENIQFFVANVETFYQFDGLDWVPALRQITGENYLSIQSVTGEGIAFTVLGTDDVFLLKNVPISAPAFPDAVYVSGGYLKLT